MPRRPGRFSAASAMLGRRFTGGSGGLPVASWHFYAGGLDCRVGCQVVADNLNKLVSKLGKRGPHRVLTGDLSFAGIPGKVYTPSEGKAIPGVAFGHDWKLGVDAYHATLRHLASWGIAVVAPDTEKSFAPNHRGFASDLETGLQILAGVRLGQGNITVRPNNLYLAGHGMGGAAAVLAASGREATKNLKGYSGAPSVAGVAAIFPSDSAPSVYKAARNVEAPGLVLEAGSLGETPTGNPKRLATNWAGDVTYRRIDKAMSGQLHEKALRNFVLGSGLPSPSTQELLRALLTGFILAGSESSYKTFRNPEAALKKTTVFSREELVESLPENADPIKEWEKRRR